MSLIPRHNENYKYTNINKYTNANVADMFYVDEYMLRYNGARASNTRRKERRIMEMRNLARTRKNMGKPLPRSQQASRNVFAKERAAFAKTPESKQWKLHNLLSPVKKAGKRKTLKKQRK